MNTMSNTGKEIASRLGIAAKATFGIWGDAPDKYRAAIDYIQAQRTPSSAAMSDLKKAIKRRRSEAAQAKNPQTKEMLEDDAGGLENILEYAQRGDRATLLRSAYNKDTAVRDDIPIEMFIWAGADVNWSHRNAKSLLDTVSQLVSRSKHGKSEMAMDSRYKVGDTVVSRVAAQGMKKGQTYKVTDISVQDTPWGTFFDYQLDGKLWVGNGHLVLDKVNASRAGNKAKFGNWFVSHTADLLRSAPYAAGEAKLQAKMLQAQAAQLEKYVAELKAIKDPGSSDPETRDRVIALHTAIDAAVSLFKREMPNKFSRPGAKAEMAAEGRVNVDGVEYRVLPYQVDYFKADLAKFDDPKWRKQIVQHYLKKNYIIRASRPGAKAKMAKIDGSVTSVALANPYLASVPLILKDGRRVTATRKDGRWSIAEMPEVPARRATTIYSFVEQLNREGFSRAGAKATMSAQQTVAMNVDRAEQAISRGDRESARKWIKAAQDALDDTVTAGGLRKRLEQLATRYKMAANEVEETEEQKAGLKLMAASNEAVSNKIRTLIAEGKPQDQAVAIALDMKRRGEI